MISGLPHSLRSGHKLFLNAPAPHTMDMTCRQKLLVDVAWNWFFAVQPRPLPTVPTSLSAKPLSLSPVVVGVPDMGFG